MSDELRLPRLPPRGGSTKVGIAFMIAFGLYGVVFAWRWPDKPGQGLNHHALYAMMAFCVLVLLGSWAWNVRKYLRFAREDATAHAALRDGDFSRAKETFWRWSECEIPRVAALSRHNLAWTLLRQGELKDAIAIANTTYLPRYSRELKSMRTLPTTMIDLALCHALSGNIEVANRAIAQLEQRKDLTANVTFPAMKSFTQAVIACREGRASDAARMLEEKWAAHESLLTGDLLRLFRVLRAFAIASADTRDAGKADLQLVNARPAFAGEYDFLGKAWPEMQTFLAAHELATSSVHPS
jgi:hypothetical protein